MPGYFRRVNVEFGWLLGLVGALGLGLLIATQPPATSGLVLLASLGGFLTLVRPAWVFLLLPLAVPFGEWRTISIGGAPAGGVEFLLAGIGAAWLVRGLARREVRLPRAPLLLPFLAFLTTLLLSVFSAAALPPAFKELAKWGEALAAYSLALVFAEAAGPRRGRYLAALVLAVVLAATLEALSGIAQSILRIGPPSYAILGGRLWRAFGEFGQPNPFGGYINLTLLPLLSGLVGLVLSGLGPVPSPPPPSLRGKGLPNSPPFIREGPGERSQLPSLPGKRLLNSPPFVGEGPGERSQLPSLRRGEPVLSEEKEAGGEIFLSRALQSRIFPVVLGAVVAILGLALVLSWSRGAWLGAAAGGMVLLVTWLGLTLGWPAPDRAEAIRRRAMATLWALLLVALVLALAGAANVIPASVTARFGTVSDYFGGFDVLTIEVTNENFAVVERVAHWYAAANMWADHLWTGVGAGNYGTVYANYRAPRWTDPLGHAHNYYLNIGAEAGLLGLLAYLWLMLAAVVRTLQVAVNRRDWASRSLAIGVLATLVAVGVHHLFDNLYVHSMGVHLAILLGLVDSTDARPR